LRRRLGYHELLNRKDAGEITSRFLEWRRAGDHSRPFFAFLNFFDAHTPYLPPRAFEEQFVRGPRWPRYEYGRNLIRWMWPDSLSEENLLAEQSAYEGSIAYLDSELGKLFDEMEREGILQNTIVIITSDHGDEFNEHGVVLHGYDLYYPLINVPLVIAGPGVPSGVRVPDPVTLRDISATVLYCRGARCRISGPSPIPRAQSGHQTNRAWYFRSCGAGALSRRRRQRPRATCSRSSWRVGTT
jgi:arylsulfatase A-like enzyme